MKTILLACFLLVSAFAIGQIEGTPNSAPSNSGSHTRKFTGTSNVSDSVKVQRRKRGMEFHMGRSTFQDLGHKIQIYGEGNELVAYKDSTWTILNGPAALDALIKSSQNQVQRLEEIMSKQNKMINQLTSGQKPK